MEASSAKSFVAMPVIEDPASDDEEHRASDNDEDDPDWVSGLTPAAFEKRAVSRIARGKVNKKVNCIRFYVCDQFTICYTIPFPRLYQNASNVT